MKIQERIIRFLKYIKHLRTGVKMLILYLSISIIIITGQLLILTKIYYKTCYEGDLQNFDYLIEKVESFDYIKYGKYQGYDQRYNLSKNSGTYIDRDYIEYLKEKIDSDFPKFHWCPFHTHYLHYTFNATEESQIFFSYNNNSVISGQYKDSKAIFVAFWHHDYGDNLIWKGKSFINYSQVPYVSENNPYKYFPFNKSSTISLNNTILIKMESYYCYDYAMNDFPMTCTTEQFIVLNSNLQIIFIYISHRSGCWSHC